MTTSEISIPDDQRAQESLQLALIDAERSGVSQRTVSDVAREARQRCADELIVGILHPAPMSRSSRRRDGVREGGVPPF